MLTAIDQRLVFQMPHVFTGCRNVSLIFESRIKIKVIITICIYH